MTDTTPYLIRHLADIPKRYGVSPYGVLDTNQQFKPGVQAPGGLGDLSQNLSLPHDYMRLSQANGNGFGAIPQPPQRPANLQALQDAQSPAGSMGGPSSPPVPPPRPADLGAPQSLNGQGNGFQNFFDRLTSKDAPIGKLRDLGIGVTQGIAPAITQAGSGLAGILDHLFGNTWNTSHP